MKKYIFLVVVLVLIGSIFILNLSEDDVEKLMPRETTLPERVSEEIPNLYIEERVMSHSYGYIFDPKEYETNDEVYIMIALGDVAMRINIDEDKNIVELIPLYYPKLNNEQIVWDSKDFGDESESLSYRFTMHRININNANEYEYEFVLAEDPHAEFLRRPRESGDVGARGASRLPEIMKKRS